MRLGFHVSIAGGFARSVERAHDLGCTCMQIFSRNPRGWAVKPLDRADVAEFRKLREKLDIAPVFVHANYLVNLASFRPDLYVKSVEQLVVDLERTDALGAEYLVTHLGSASGRSEEWMTERVSNAIAMALKLYSPKAGILLENTAGETGDIGYSLEQVQAVMDSLPDSSRIGICYDTCHGFAAGYDIRTKADVDALAETIRRTVGLERLKGLHLNDALRDLSSRVDRHWHIGEGRIGLEGFRTLLNHPAFKNIPKIMETPKKSEEDDPRNMRVARSLVRQDENE